MDNLELDIATKLPDHTQLPCEDGNFVKNFQEHPQSILLTESIWSKLQEKLGSLKAPEKQER